MMHTHLRVRLAALTFPSAREELSDNEDLQASHRHHHDHLHQAEVEDTLLGTPHRAEVPVLSCAEVLLLSRQDGHLP